MVHGAPRPERAPREEPADLVPTCIECGGLASLVDGKAIYPHRPDLYAKSFYRCECGAYCGCHPKTIKPLGYPCGPTTRKARSAAHAAFDPLWRKGTMNRRDAYLWLAKHMNIPAASCHIGMMTEDQAKKVVEIVNIFSMELAA